MSSYTFHRVPSTVWLECSQQRLSDDARLCYLYLWTCPHRTYPALYRLPLGYAAADLGWPEARVRAALEALEAAELVEYDAEVEVVYVPAAFRAECPMNRRQAVGALRQVASLPPTRLLWSLLADAARWAPALADLLRARIHGASQPADTLSHSLCDTLSDTLSAPSTEVPAAPAMARRAQAEIACASDPSGPPPARAGDTLTRACARAREVDSPVRDLDSRNTSAAAADLRHTTADCQREHPEQHDCELAPWERWYAERHQGLLPGRTYRDRINRMRAGGLEDRVIIAALELARQRGARYPAAYACHVLADAYDRGVRTWDDWQRLCASEAARSGDGCAAAAIREERWEPSAEQREVWRRRMAELDRVAAALARGETVPWLDDHPANPPDFPVTEPNVGPTTVGSSLARILRNAKITPAAEGQP